MRSLLAKRVRAGCLALLVFGSALAFRLAMLEHYPSAGPWVAGLTLADAEMGRNLVEGRGWSANARMIERATQAQGENLRMVDLQDLLPVDDHDPANRTTVGSAHSPGYSVWFAISYWLGGEYRYVHAQRMQAVADAIAAVLVFLIGWRCWSLLAGLLGGLLYAASPAHAFLANLTVAASTDSLWFLMVAYGAILTCRAAHESRPLWPGAAVVTFGAFCGACMNSTAVVLPTIVGGLALVAGVVNRRFLRAATVLVVVQVVVLLALTPWAFRNQREYGQFSFVRGTFWQLAFAAWGELPNPWGLGFEDKEYFHWIDENCAGCSAQQAAVRSFLLRDVAASAPFIRHVRRLVELRLPRALEVAQTPGGVLGSGPIAKWLEREMLVWDRWLAWIAAACGLGLLIALLRSPQRVPLLVGLGPTLFLTLFSLVFYVELRKTIPGYGFMLAMGGILAAMVIEWVGAGGRRLAGAAAATAAAVLFLHPSGDVAAQGVVSGGEYHTVVANEAGQVWGFGSNIFGQIGNTAHAAAAESASLVAVDSVTRVAAGSSHSVALRRDGRVWTWGDNSWGQLGDGTLEPRVEPVLVPGLERVTALGAGYVHTLALDADGAVWAWGNGLYGQLGVAGVGEALAPVRVPLPRRAVAVAAGWFFSLALDDRGRVWAWGRNRRGQLGTGTFEDHHVPVEVPGLERIEQVAAGHLHALARSADAVFAWGANDYGQISGPIAGQARSIPNPRRVEGIPLPASVAVAGDVSLSLDADGTVWAWGDNLYGQLGNGSFVAHAAPGPVRGLPPVDEIAGGYAHAVAVARDGVLWSWGFGHYGQLGDSFTGRRRSVPATIRAVRAREPVIPLDPKRDFVVDRTRTQWTDAALAFVDQSVVVRGEVPEEKRQTYTVVAQPVKAGPGSPYKLFFAQGILRRGGITVGVLSQDRWAFSKTIASPGPFTILWTPPEDIAANAVIANFLTRDDRNVDAEITRWGWLTSTDLFPAPVSTVPSQSAK